MTSTNPSDPARSRLLHKMHEWDQCVHDPRVGVCSEVQHAAAHRKGAVTDGDAAALLMLPI